MIQIMQVPSKNFAMFGESSNLVKTQNIAPRASENIMDQVNNLIQENLIPYT